MAELDNVAPGGVVNLSDAPAGLDDATFDSLFPAEATSVKIAPAKQETPAPTATDGQPNGATTPNPSDFFLKGDKSVYKTAEDALKGVNEKDTLIENLRQRYALTTGIDPITGQPVQAVQQQQQTENDYYQNPQLYLDELYKAAKTSPEAYRDAQSKFIMDTLKPIQPLVAKMARDNALASIATEIPNIDKFMGSPAYNKALESNPELKGAIATAETDSRFYGRLGGLVKLAYYAAQGQALPDLIKAAQAQPTTNNNQPSTPAQVRTTTTPTTPSAPRETARPNFRSIEGIKAVIAAQEAAGAKLDF